jgi:hypothetical protein
MFLKHVNIMTPGGVKTLRAYRIMRRLVVDMDECALHVRKDLYLVLQLLAEVVGLP